MTPSGQGSSKRLPLHPRPDTQVHMSQAGADDGHAGSPPVKDMIKKVLDDQNQVDQGHPILDRNVLPEHGLASGPHWADAMTGQSSLFGHVTGVSIPSGFPDESVETAETVTAETTQAPPSVVSVSESAIDLVPNPRSAQPQKSAKKVIQKADIPKPLEKEIKNKKWEKWGFVVKILFFPLFHVWPIFWHLLLFISHVTLLVVWGIFLFGVVDLFHPQDLKSLLEEWGKQQIIHQSKEIILVWEGPAQGSQQESPVMVNDEEKGEDIAALRHQLDEKEKELLSLRAQWQAGVSDGQTQTQRLTELERLVSEKEASIASLQQRLSSALATSRGGQHNQDIWRQILRDRRTSLHYVLSNTLAQNQWSQALENHPVFREAFETYNTGGRQVLSIGYWVYPLTEGGQTKLIYYPSREMTATAYFFLLKDTSRIEFESFDLSQFSGHFPGIPLPPDRPQ